MSIVPLLIVFALAMVIFQKRITAAVRAVRERRTARGSAAVARATADALALTRRGRLPRPPAARTAPAA